MTTEKLLRRFSRIWNLELPKMSIIASLTTPEQLESDGFYRAVHKMRGPLTVGVMRKSRHEKPNTVSTSDAVLFNQAFSNDPRIMTVMLSLLCAFLLLEGREDLAAYVSDADDLGFLFWRFGHDDVTFQPVTTALPGSAEKAGVA
jgi:hypothetical protein